MCLCTHSNNDSHSCPFFFPSFLHTKGAYQQEANEEDVCNFVASLVENNYDEYGEIILESEELSWENWANLKAYKRDVVKVTNGQIFGLMFSIGCVLLLSAYVAYLRYKLKHRAPWIAGKYGFPGRGLSRIHSGITMQRSVSGVEPAMTTSGSFA